MEHLEWFISCSSSIHSQAIQLILIYGAKYIQYIGVHAHDGFYIGYSVPNTSEVLSYLRECHGSSG